MSIFESINIHFSSDDLHENFDADDEDDDDDDIDRQKRDLDGIVLILYIIKNLMFGNFHNILHILSVHVKLTLNFFLT